MCDRSANFHDSAVSLAFLNFFCGLTTRLALLTAFYILKCNMCYLKSLNENGNLVGNVSVSLSVDGTFSDIFDHEKLAHPAESTPCLKFYTSDDLSVELSKKASCL